MSKSKAKQEYYCKTEVLVIKCTQYVVLLDDYYRCINTLVGFFVYCVYYECKQHVDVGGSGACTFPPIITVLGTNAASGSSLIPENKPSSFNLSLNRLIKNQTKAAAAVNHTKTHRNTRLMYLP